jgi:sec-independent protein translocase protein TatC
MSNGTPDPDDFFADTRMSFGDHIEDLRTHLWRALKGFGIALVFSFFIGKPVVGFITAPVRAELQKFYEHRTRKLLAEPDQIPELAPARRATPFFQIVVPRQQAEALAKGQSVPMKQPRIVSKQESETRQGKTSLFGRLGNWLGNADEPAEDEKDKFEEFREEDLAKDFVTFWASFPNPLHVEGYLQPATRRLLDIDNPTTLRVEEAFMVWFKVCLVCGFVLGSPWIFYQVWAFVAAGLYPHEKRLVHVYLPVSLFLFLVGVFICQFLVIPKAIEALLWFNEWLGMKPDMRLNEWLGFAIFMPVIFGLSFQTPLVMMFVGRLGIVDADSFRNKRRYAWFLMAVFAAIVTPSVDALSMLFLWVPMSLLFELGIWLIKMQPKQPGLDEDVPEPDEMVEV